MAAPVCLGLAQCGGGESERPPARVVAAAARTTFKPAPALIALKVASPGARFETRGPVELASGRFRARVRGEAPPFLRRGGSRTVLATSGEGLETTYFVTHESFGHPARSERCWYNPHAPVGSNRGTASVEESMRLVGSVLESLRRELKTAQGSAGPEQADEYEVTLRSSASHPRDDFKDSRRRVWGDRALLAGLDGPINVVVSDAGKIAGIAMELHGYRPAIGWVSRRRAPRPVSIQATIASTVGQLHLREPGCLAME